jgi:hypothetical protein
MMLWRDISVLIGIAINALFKDERGKESEAQITVFDDTQHWS